MSYLDKAKQAATDKVRTAAEQARAYATAHEAQILSGIDKAEQAADARTGGKQHTQIAKGADRARAYLQQQVPPATSGPAAADTPPTRAAQTEPAPAPPAPVAPTPVEAEPAASAPPTPINYHH